MSFEDTKCPCGGKKLTDTMLCSDCETAFKDHPSMKYFNNPAHPIDGRRHAAITLITLARGRKRKS